MEKNNLSPLGFAIIALTLIFVAGKVFNFIDWSWIWVLSPLWGVVALGVLLALLYFALDKASKRGERKAQKLLAKEAKRQEKIAKAEARENKKTEKIAEKHQKDERKAEAIVEAKPQRTIKDVAPEATNKTNKPQEHITVLDASISEFDEYMYLLKLDNVTTKRLTDQTDIYEYKDLGVSNYQELINIPFLNIEISVNFDPRFYERNKEPKFELYITIDDGKYEDSIFSTFMTYKDINITDEEESIMYRELFKRFPEAEKQKRLFYEGVKSEEVHQHSNKIVETYDATNSEGETDEYYETVTYVTKGKMNPLTMSDYFDGIKRFAELHYETADDCVDAHYLYEDLIKEYL